MITDSKKDFSSVVDMHAEEFRQKSFECIMNGFVKKVILKSSEIEIPKVFDPDMKIKLADEVRSSIDETTKQIIKNAKIHDETSREFDVNIAHEILNPETLSQSVGHTVAQHVFEESDARKQTLESMYDSGMFRGQTPEQIDNYIKLSYEDLMFKKEYAYGKSLAAKLKQVFSIEGEELVDSIKSDVNSIVEETEDKNSIIREAISEINDRKEEIEKEINGEDSRAEEPAPKSDDGEGEDSQNEEGEGGDDSGADNNGGEEETPPEQGVEAWAPRNNKKIFTMSDIIYSVDNNYSAGKSAESFVPFDKNSFSREAAEEILNEFKELDGDLDSGVDGDNVRSTSDEAPEGGESTSDNGGEQHDAASQSSEDDDDNEDGDSREVDKSKFATDEQIDEASNAEKLSEENLAKKLIPLSIERLKRRDSVINRRNLTAYLACNPDHGSQFFKHITSRFNEVSRMMSEESIADEDPTNQKLKSNLGRIEDIKGDVEELMNNMGILGILDGKYQRTDSPVENAVKSLANPKLLSKESIEENKYADIFKLVLKFDEINSDIAKGVDVVGNRNQLGLLEELINEKIFALDDVAKFDVEEKVKALQSVESIVPFQDIVNMQVFVSKATDAPAPKRIELDSFKNIDIYGYSYADEIDKIKKSVTEKYKDYTSKSKGKAVINFDIDQLVNFVAEQVDTTSYDANIYERIITKLVADKTIETSSESWIIRNKAKIITTAFVAGEKLGYLSENDVQTIKMNIA